MGAGIHFDTSRSKLRPLIVAMLARQAVFPIIASCICYLTGLSGLERAAVLLHAALPTGPAAYAVAKQLGGDAPLMANIITATTLSAVFLRSVLVINISLADQIVVTDCATGVFGRQPAPNITPGFCATADFLRCIPTRYCGTFALAISSSRVDFRSA